MLDDDLAAGLPVCRAQASPRTLVQRLRSRHAVGGDRFRDKKGVPGYVNKMPEPTKLALEMALHEEQERRALEGELWRLTRAWEEAEEIAAISDSLFLPEGTGEFIERHRSDEDAA